MFDAPKHTAWSPRGDLAIGAGNQYTLVGVHGTQPVTEPWEVDNSSQEGGRDEKSLDRRSAGKQSRPHSRAPSPGFGRGDKDGFPALVSINGSKSKLGRSSSSSPAPEKVTGGYLRLGINRRLNRPRCSLLIRFCQSSEYPASPRGWFRTEMCPEVVGMEIFLQSIMM